MAESSERSKGQEINSWVQTVGIVMAALWGGYTFVYKEIMLPKSAPVNVSVDLQLKKLGPPDSQLQKREEKALIAVEMSVSATNPSSRIVYLFPSIWIARGYKIETFDKNPKFEEQANFALNLHTRGIIDIGKYGQRAGGSFADIAVGGVFTDDTLKPSERITRKTVFYVPSGQFDLIDVEVYIMTFAKKGAATLEWKYNEKDGSIAHTLYRVGKSGKPEEVKVDKDKEYVGISDLELQRASSTSTLSLWQ